MIPVIIKTGNCLPNRRYLIPMHASISHMFFTLNMIQYLGTAVR